MTTALVALLTTACLIAVAYGPHRFGLTSYAASFRLGFLGRDALMDRNYDFFCWGQYSKTGFFWYFFAAYLLKAPIPMLLATLALVAWLIRRRFWRSLDEIVLVLPVVAFLVATMLITDDLGIRYILPIYPFLFILIGGMCTEIWRWACQHSETSKRILATAGTILAAVYVTGTIWIYPNYLSFFNGLIVGPSNGIRYLDDSNIDLGQDFKQLARYLREHGISDVKGAYQPADFLPYLTRYYGVFWTWMSLEELHTPTPGWYAVSAQMLQRPVVATAPGYGNVRFDWLDRFEPVERIGYSIYLYHFD
jgi:hypothetical protein